MKTFRQFQEALEKRTWRGPDLIDGPRGRPVLAKHNRLQNVDFRDNDKVAGAAVKVQFNKSRSDPRRSYNVDFSINNRFHRPDHHDDPSAWRDYEKVTSHLPSIMRRVKKSIEGFVSEKKPNQIRMQANDESKVKLYRTFAHHIARKHGGRVEERPYSEYDDNPEFIIHLPGKQLREATKLVRKYYRDTSMRTGKTMTKPITQTFEDEGKVGLPYKVTFQRYHDDPKRSYIIDFSVADRYMAPKEGDSWDSPEEVRRHKDNAHNIPEILKRIRGHIEDFAAKKRPNTLKFSPNEPHKTPLYRAFAQALAKKHGGTVKVDYTLGHDTPTFIINLPGKKTLKESKVLDAAKAAVKKNWKTKLALAATPLPGTIVAAGAMAVKDAISAYRGSK